MKSAETKTAAVPAKSGSPFFNKGADTALFNDTETPFFQQQANQPFFVQAKLTVGEPNDQYEQEADRMADHVVQRQYGHAMVQTKCEACEAKEKGIQKKEEQSAPAKDPGNIESKLHASKGSGSPLPKDTRSEMEGSFGADFSGVRIHDNSEAVQMNQQLNAQAFAHGNDIYFNSGKYNPGSTSGKHLLAHELTHTIQQGGSKVRAKSMGGTSRVQKAESDMPNVQASWYNFSIPFTDYEFDPSIEGVKNAGKVVYEGAKEGATWVAEKVEEGVMWIVDQVRGIVTSGINWLKSTWESLKQLGSGGIARLKAFLGNFTKLLVSPFSGVIDTIMAMDGQLLSAAWNGFTGGVTRIWTGFKKTTLSVVDGVFAFWNTISAYATSVLSKVNSITQSYLFSKLPEALQGVVRGLIQSITAIWQVIQSEWTAFQQTVKNGVALILNTVEVFVNRILSFAIRKIIDGFLYIGKLVLTIVDFFKNPDKYLNALSKTMAGYLIPAEAGFGSFVGQYFGGGKKEQQPANAAAATVIRRAPEDKGATGTRSTASWSAIGNSVWGVMKQKWNEFKKNPSALLKGLLMDAFLPMVGNYHDVVNLYKDIKKVVLRPMSVSSLEEFWTSLLNLLDIPILILHTIVGILGRSLMLPLLIASFIPHPLVKAAATAIGEALLASFVEIELINIAHKVLLLKTGLNDDEQKKDAYNRVGDSLIAFATAAVIAALIFIIAALAQVVKGVVNFVKGKIFPPVEVVAEPGAAEGKGTAPEENKPAEEPKKTELTPEEIEKLPSSADGKRKLEIGENGECEVCNSPCEGVREKYAEEMTPEIEGELSAIEGKKGNKAGQIEELKPVEQELADAKKGVPSPSGPTVEQGIKVGDEVTVPRKGGRTRAEVTSIDENYVKVKYKSGQQGQGDVTQLIPRERFNEMVRQGEIVPAEGLYNYLIRNRPQYRKGIVEQVWEQARVKGNGKVIDPLTKQEITWDQSQARSGQWDMGHKYGMEYRDLVKRLANGEITNEEFLAEYNDPSHYQPELPSSNQSHAGEKK